MAQQEMIILRGIPASSKSTYAKTWVLSGKNRVRVCRDDIRIACLGAYSGVDEELVSKIEQATIVAALKQGKSVIVDATNIKQKYVNRYANMAYDNGVTKVSIKQFDIPLGEALARNAERDRKVPVDVIERMHKDVVKKVELPAPLVIEPYVPNTDLPSAVIIDIDGTLANMNGSRGPFDWQKVDLDEPVEAIIGLANLFYIAGYTVIIMSGRDSCCREKTEAWLKSFVVMYDKLFMRTEGDMRRDNIVKHELFDKYVRNLYNVEYVVDDRAQVVNMWRQLGLTVLQCADGDF